MTITEAARDYKEEIREGIAYVAIWKIRQNGRGGTWCARAFWQDGTKEGGEPTFRENDIQTFREIIHADPNAVLLNGYYCGWFGNRTLADIANAFKAHYEAGNFLLADALEINGSGEPESSKEDAEELTVSAAEDCEKKEGKIMAAKTTKCTECKHFLRGKPPFHNSGICDKSGYRFGCNSRACGKFERRK